MHGFLEQKFGGNVVVVVVVVVIVVVVVVVEVVVGVKDISQKPPVNPCLHKHLTSIPFSILHAAPLKHTFRPVGHNTETLDVVEISQTSPEIKINKL